MPRKAIMCHPVQLEKSERGVRGGAGLPTTGGYQGRSRSGVWNGRCVPSLQSRGLAE